MDAIVERKHEKYDRLIAKAQQADPPKTAVVHPCDHNSLEGALDAARLRLMAPILVGPAGRIRQVAADLKLDISALPLVSTEHSHASAARAVELVREGKAEALMKGSLHTDELMSAVVKSDGGLRTSRRLSHCFIMDVRGHSEPLIITDAAVNILPTLSDKVDIVAHDDSRITRELVVAEKFGDARMMRRNTKANPTAAAPKPPTRLTSGNG